MITRYRVRDLNDCAALQAFYPPVLARPSEERVQVGGHEAQEPGGLVVELASPVEPGAAEVVPA